MSSVHGLLLRSSISRETPRVNMTSPRKVIQPRLGATLVEAGPGEAAVAFAPKRPSELATANAARTATKAEGTTFTAGTAQTSCAAEAPGAEA
jgi:hypothetical protein